MVSGCGCRCKGHMTTYFLEVEREHESIRLWTRMKREQNNVLPGGGVVRLWTQI